MIIDATDMIMGRLGAYAAKKALLGEKVDVVNCEKCVISGDKYRIFRDYDNLLKRGTHSKGPFLHRAPDKVVKRVIRGMIPYKQGRGIKAFKNVRCYIGVPEVFKSQKFETVKGANVEKLPNLKYVTVRDVCKHIGARIK
jgi:large subunit ribosomal protein L13